VVSRCEISSLKLRGLGMGRKNIDVRAVRVSSRADLICGERSGRSHLPFVELLSLFCPQNCFNSCRQLQFKGQSL
jgi:hypothetical protein